MDTNFFSFISNIHKQNRFQKRRVRPTVSIRTRSTIGDHQHDADELTNQYLIDRLPDQVQLLFYVQSC